MCWMQETLDGKFQVCVGPKQDDGIGLPEREREPRMPLLLMHGGMTRILPPARSCIIMPEVTMGLTPSSMRVPWLEARITCIQLEWIRQVRGHDAVDGVLASRPRK